MTHAEKLAEIARIGNYLCPPSDQAATRDCRNAGVAWRREADPQQAGSVCVPAPGRRASGARPDASYFDGAPVWFAAALFVIALGIAGLAGYVVALVCGVS